MKRLRLQYGTGGIELATDANVTVIAPRFVKGLPDEAGAFREAVRKPIGARPLRDLVGARDRVASEIPADDLSRAHVEAVSDVSARLAEELEEVGREAPVAVLPEGPMTIPSLRG